MPSLSVAPQTPLILALDTSSNRGSVALAQGAQILKALSFEGDHSHSQRLLPAIESVFEDAQRQIGEVDLFAVVIGPGSFTGLRVSLACVRGLAGTKPCFGALAPDVAAWAGRGRGATLLALTDLFHGEVFGGVYNDLGALITNHVSGALSSVIPALQDSITIGAMAVGSATVKHRADLESLCLGINFLDLPEGLAPHLASLASARATEGATCGASDLLPFYLRDPLTRGLLSPSPRRS
ncbi:MAG: tRNA (adenosine(37)-N6)-threonylcarbamoyltransferase complex dimerization subunit type 1 TsaB [Vicinamibacteria bacterium]|nr:tRNA (adenosine(37)-N6)-threonylcarbamoyltransferase complex dimerization subunit type 1 TsaB [Vicinamibacteria bacterium]